MMSLLRPSTAVLPALLIAAASVQAQPGGIAYTASPVGVGVRFDDNAGLGSGFLYGGRVGAAFGRYLELDGEYLRSTGVKTDFGGIDAPTGVDVLLGTLPERDVLLERYGANLRATIGRTRLLPFLTAGTGVVRIKPDGTDDTRSIYATYGGGVTLALGTRSTVTLAASRFAYRYSPFATFGLGDQGLAPESMPLRTVYNNALTAAARIYLGGRSAAEETAVDRAFTERLRVFVEPSYGTIDFSRRLGAAFPDQQPLAGVSAGIDLGPYVGLRGSYLRATDEASPLDDGVPTTFRDLALIGGELDLRFAGDGGGGGATPYLIVGGGYLRVGDDYAPGGTSGVPESRYFAQGGAGLDLAIARTVRLKAAARAVLMSDLDEDAVATPGRVYVSPLYTGGVEFSLGGRRINARDTRDVDALLAAERRRMADERAAERMAYRSELDGQRAEEVAEARAIQARLSGEIAALRRQLDVTTDDSARAALVTEIAVRERVAAETVPLAASAPGTTASPRAAPARRTTIEVPVPETGEIYIRYGDPAAVPVPAAAPTPVVVTAAPAGSVTGGTGGLTADQITALVRAELDRRDGRALTRDDVDRIVRDVTRAANTGSAAPATSAFDASLAARLAAIEARMATPQAQQFVVIESSGVQRIVSVPAAPAVVPAAAQVGFFGARRLAAVLPVVGFRTDGTDTQGLIGVRADYRSLSGLGMRVIPEVLVGIGDGVSVQAFANVAWPLPTAFGLQPYLGGGVGLKTDKGVKGAGLALNALIGTELGLGIGYGFIEASTLDFFDVNRLLFGYRVRF